MPSAQHLLLKQLLTAATGPLARRRPGLGALRLGLEIGTLFQLMPWGVLLEEVEVDGRIAEWIRPTDAAARRVLLYLHGGGYVLGSLNTHRSLIGTLARRCQLNTLAIDYRKAPEHPFPAALDDALSAFRWLRRSGYAAHDIIVAGDSAGGGLALALLIALRDAGEPLPAAAVGLSPWTDLALAATGRSAVAREEVRLLEALEMRAWGSLYAGGTSLKHPLVSPVHAELHGLPALLIQLSDAETLCSDGLNFVQKARTAGVPITLQVFPGLVHWWHLFWRFVPEASTALDQVAAFVRSIWAAQASDSRKPKTAKRPREATALSAAVPTKQ